MSCCSAGPCAMLTGRAPRSPKKRDTVTRHLSTSNCVLVNSSGHSWEEAYEVESEVLGEGGFGTVRKAKQKHGGRVVVMKTMLKEGIPDMDLFAREISVQGELDHPHIVRLYETFEDRKVIYLMMEPCDGGEVLDILEKNDGVVSELDAWNVANQLLSALSYMHEDRHIVHRDLKPENFLMKEKNGTLADCHLKLIDFGFARHFEAGTKQLTTQCGTPCFMAPEIMSGPYDEKCDIWSSGCILFLFLGGDPPFDDDSEDPAEIVKKARDSQPNFDTTLMKKRSMLARSLLRNMLNKHPDKRFSAKAILAENDWMKQERAEVAALQRSGSTVSRRRSSGKDISDNLVAFSKLNYFKKKALETVAHLMDDSDIEEIRDTFEQIDTDGTGTISIEEMRKACEEINMDADVARKLVAAAEVHGNNLGELNYTDFITSQLMSHRSEYLKECYVWEAFRIFDKDGDGKISISELEQMLTEDSTAGLAKAGIHCEKGEIESLIQKFDSNGDGVIDFDEFMTMMKEK